MKAATAQLDDQSSGTVSYRVLYANAGVKKRKSFSDGFLHIKSAPGNSFSVSLVSEEGDELRKSIEKNIKSFKESAEVTCGAYLVQLEDMVSTPSGTSNPSQQASVAVLSSKYTPSATKPFISSTTSNSQTLKPTNKFINPVRTLLKPPALKLESLQSNPHQTENEPPTMTLPSTVDAGDDFWDQEITAPVAPAKSSSFNSGTHNLKFSKNVATTTTHTSNITSTITNAAAYSRPYTTSTTSATTSPNKVEQDPSLMRVMRPHQIVGADFLIARLLNSPTTTSSGVGNDSCASAGDDVGSGYSEFDLEVDRDNVCTGAILADEVSSY